MSKTEPAPAPSAKGTPGKRIKRWTGWLMAASLLVPTALAVAWLVYQWGDEAPSPLPAELALRGPSVPAHLNVAYDLIGIRAPEGQEANAAGQAMWHQQQDWAQRRIQHPNVSTAQRDASLAKLKAEEEAFHSANRPNALLPTPSFLRTITPGCEQRSDGHAACQEAWWRGAKVTLELAKPHQLWLARCEAAADRLLGHAGYATSLVQGAALGTQLSKLPSANQTTAPDSVSSTPPQIPQYDEPLQAPLYAAIEQLQGSQGGSCARWLQRSAIAYWALSERALAQRQLQRAWALSRAMWAGARTNLTAMIVRRYLQDVLDTIVFLVARTPGGSAHAQAWNEQLQVLPAANATYAQALLTDLHHGRELLDRWTAHCSQGPAVQERSQPNVVKQGGASPAVSAASANISPPSTSAPSPPVIPAEEPSGWLDDLGEAANRFACRHRILNHPELSKRLGAARAAQSMAILPTVQWGPWLKEQAELTKRELGYTTTIWERLLSREMQPPFMGASSHTSLAPSFVDTQMHHEAVLLILRRLALEHSQSKAGQAALPPQALNEQRLQWLRANSSDAVELKARWEVGDEVWATVAPVLAASSPALSPAATPASSSTPAPATLPAAGQAVPTPLRLALRRWESGSTTQRYFGFDLTPIAAPPASSPAPGRP